MKKSQHKILALLLAVLLVAGVLPMTVSAAATHGETVTFDGLIFVGKSQDLFDTDKRNIELSIYTEGSNINSEVQSPQQDFTLDPGSYKVSLGEAATGMAWSRTVDASSIEFAIQNDGFYSIVITQIVSDQELQVDVYNVEFEAEGGGVSGNASVTAGPDNLTFEVFMTPGTGAGEFGFTVHAGPAPENGGDIELTAGTYFVNIYNDIAGLEGKSKTVTSSELEESINEDGIYSWTLYSQGYFSESIRDSFEIEVEFTPDGGGEPDPTPTITSGSVERTGATKGKASFYKSQGGGVFISVIPFDGNSKDMTSQEVYDLANQQNNSYPLESTGPDDCTVTFNIPNGISTGRYQVDIVVGANRDNISEPVTLTLKAWEDGGETGGGTTQPDPEPDYPAYNNDNNDNRRPFVPGDDSDDNDDDYGRRTTSGGGGGGGSSAATNNTPTTVTTSNATASVTAALANAANGSATAKLTNPGDISLATLQSMADQAGNTELKVNADSLNGNAVDVRISFDPSAATGNLNLSASTVNPAAESRKAQFEKFFANDLMAVSLGQQGSFGMPVQIAAKLDPALDTDNLVFYSYNSTTAVYTPIAAPAYWVDANGYVHFTTTLGGSIIISDGSLNKR